MLTAGKHLAVRHSDAPMLVAHDQIRCATMWGTIYRALTLIGSGQRRAARSRALICVDGRSLAACAEDYSDPNHL
jgi:hypothetical protein